MNWISGNSLRSALVGLLLGIALSIAAIFGFVAVTDWSLTRSEQVTKTNDNVPVGTSDTSTHSTKRPFEVGSLFQQPHDFNQVVEWYSLLSVADEDSLRDLLDASRSISSHTQGQAARSAIIRRYASISPSRALEFAQTLPKHERESLLPGVFSEWAILDLDEAVSNANSLDFRAKQIALQTILRTRDDLPVNLRNQLAERLDGKSFAGALIGEEHALSLIENPPAAWSALISDGQVNQYRVNSFVQIAVAWIDRDGLEVLEQISTSLTEEVDNAFEIMNQVAIAVAQTNAEEAFNFVVTLDPTVQRGLMSSLVRAWSTIDPSAALRAVDSLDANSSARYQIAGILYRWIKTDPNEILPILDTFSQQVKSQAMERVLAETVRTSPETALRLMRDWENAGNNLTSVTGAFVRAWSEIDPESSLDWLLDQADKNLFRYSDMVEDALKALAPVDWKRAFEVALEQPVADTHVPGAEATVIHEISDFDVDKALELLPRARESSMALSVLWVGQALVDDGRPLKAFELVERLPEDRREWIYYSLAQHWAGNGALELFERIDTVQSPLWRSHVAKGLIWDSMWNSVLTNDQLDHVKSFLTESHAEDVEGWKDL